jgi:hypothetical protein
VSLIPPGAFKYLDAAEAKTSEDLRAVQSHNAALPRNLLMPLKLLAQEMRRLSNDFNDLRLDDNNRNYL